LGELGVSSLKKVYKMTWREFQLRLMAYDRIERRKHEIARQSTYYAGYAFNVKNPKPIDVFWKIGNGQTITEATKERMRKALEKARAKHGKS